jgi:precorrin-2/cobalt-factor-2 C20-methyltransferase
MTAPATGTLYGISLGPGDPDLITVKGLRLLQSAAVVFVPVAEVSDRSVAAAIAEPLLRPEQRLVPLVFAMRRDPAARAAAWRDAAGRIAQVLHAGQDAAFLVEGDALTYSTFAHLAAVLHEDHPDLAVQVVPGVTSFAAASARTGEPLVDADQRLAVLPAVHAGPALEATLREFDAVVLMKVAGALDAALEALHATHRTDDAVFVERCGQPDERVVHDVRTLRGTTVDYFSLIIVRRTSAQLAQTRTGTST